ncbi:MAG: hypothetical protein U0836_18455 [Pirellulales bacterium]
MKSSFTFGKPIVCNEDEKTGRDGAAAARASVAAGISWGFMAEPVNQRFRLRFAGRPTTRRSMRSSSG